MAEQWRDISGYEGRYQVSDLGRVRKLACSVVACSARSKNGGYVWRAGSRVLTPEKKAKGLRVVLKDDLKARRFHFIDKLVLNCFRGSQSDCYPFHIDGNPLNNALSNLEWRKKGAKIYKGYETRFKKVLTESEVKKAFCDMRDNQTVAREIGISPLAVELIKQRIIWTHYTRKLKRKKRDVLPNTAFYKMEKLQEV